VPAVHPASAPAVADFNPYVPEIFDSDDQFFKFKWYTFSQRQLDYLASREFDEEQFRKYLLTKWPIEKLTEYARDTPQERLPRKVGYNAGRFLTIEVYKGLKHKFESLEVTVFDQYGHSIALHQQHHSNADGTRDEIKRWAWLISMKKGKKVWFIQSELPNREFDKQKEEQPTSCQTATKPADKDHAEVESQTPTPKEPTR
jgi:hypothetical protein